jgi:putative addiction module killer protein
VNTFVRSEVFDSWLRRLRDQKGKARIIARLEAAYLGSFGDCALVADGVYEMRIHFGPGYRVYFTRRREHVYVLVGGDKSTQKRDIRTALSMRRNLEEK